MKSRYERSRRITLWSAFAALWCTAGPLVADVDLLLTVRSPTGEPTVLEPGDTLLVDLIAQADPEEPFTVLEAIIVYDPAYITLTGYDDDNSGYAGGWGISGFRPNPDGLNDVIGDGDALYTASARLGVPAVASPDPGLVVTTLVFVIADGPPPPQTPGDGTEIAFLPTYGSYSQTIVKNIFTPVTGDISDVAIVHVLCSANDDDEDLICDEMDNCPQSPNPDQADFDEDGFGDACDNCPEDYNPDQADFDQDNLGDVCDPCPYDPDNDADEDGHCADEDNCPEDYNPDQADDDGDGAGDVCDVCPLSYNETQVVGDVDGNGVLELLDLSPFVDVLLGLDADPARVGASDVNCDGVANGLDVQSMVERLLE